MSTSTPMDKLKEDPGKIIMIVGALLAIICLFIDWTAAQNGLDYALDTPANMDYGFAPFIVLLVGIIVIALIILIILEIVPIEQQLSQWIFVILGALGVIGIALFYYDFTDLGPILGLIGAVLIIFGALFASLRK